MSTTPAEKKKRQSKFEKITVAVPPELKERFRKLAQGEMGSMSGQGRYLVLRALELQTTLHRESE